MLDFSGREVVVTGGTGALGSAVVGRLITAGAIVHVSVYIAEELQRFPYRGHEAVRVHEGLDLGKEGDVARLYGADLSALRERSCCWRLFDGADRRHFARKLGASDADERDDLLPLLS